MPFPELSGMSARSPAGSDAILAGAQSSFGKGGVVPRRCVPRTVCAPGWGREAPSYRGPADQPNGRLFASQGIKECTEREGKRYRALIRGSIGN